MNFFMYTILSPKWPIVISQTWLLSRWDDQVRSCETYAVLSKIYIWRSALTFLMLLRINLASLIASPVSLITEGELNNPEKTKLKTRVRDLVLLHSNLTLVFCQKWLDFCVSFPKADFKNILLELIKRLVSAPFSSPSWWAISQN